MKEIIDILQDVKGEDKSLRFSMGGFGGGLTIMLTTRIFSGTYQQNEKLNHDIEAHRKAIQ
jgi:hypothetical protein